LARRAAFALQTPRDIHQEELMLVISSRLPRAGVGTLRRLAVALATVALSACGNAPSEDRDPIVGGAMVQVCRDNGAPCVTACPAVTVFDGRTCTFDAAETKLRENGACTNGVDGPTGRCYYACPQGAPGGGDGLGSGGPGGVATTEVVVGQTFTISTQSPVCSTAAGLADPDGACAAGVEDDPDCEPAQCADDDACTLGYLGDDGTCRSAELPCDDGDLCTADACDPASGCQRTPVTCDDGDPCTADACDPSLGCRATPVTCDDGNPCTADACDPVLGCTAVAVAEGTHCDDGDALTVGDACAAGACVGQPSCVIATPTDAPTARATRR
jgi:hypothetical protein